MSANTPPRRPRPLIERTESAWFGDTRSTPPSTARSSCANVD